MSRSAWRRAASILVQTLFIILPLNIHLTHAGYNNIRGKNVCFIMRKERDKLVFPRCNITRNICQEFGAVGDATKCICTCPTNKQTFKDSTKQCTENKDVWQPGCKFKLRGRASIGVFPVGLSAGMPVIFPDKYKKCRFTVDLRNSYYLDHNGWHKIPLKSRCPFKIEIKTHRYGRKRIKRVTNIKWSKSPKQTKLHGKVIRLGIKACRRQFQECMVFKVSGQALHQCSTIPQPIPTLMNPQNPHTAATQITTVTVTVIPSQQPSVGDKGKRGSSDDDDSGSTPWAVIGSVIGIVAVLIICITVLVLWLYRRKQTFNGQKHKATSRHVNPPESRAEPAYAHPFHPYQDLIPTVRGAPPAAYHPLQRQAKEDSSGYLVPSPETLSSEEPIYNEIGSPQCRSPIEYDYALPEDIVRFSTHLIEKTLDENEPDYIGRPSKGQKGQNLDDGQEGHNSHEGLISHEGQNSHEGHNSHGDKPHVSEFAGTGASAQNDDLEFSGESAAYVDFIC